MSSSTTMNSRELWPDAGRVFAIMAMVMLHVTGADWHDVPKSSDDWLGICIWNGLVRWCVPVFFMISGYLFLSGPAAEKPFTSILKVNLVRLVTALTFLGAFYYWYFKPPVLPLNTQIVADELEGFVRAWYFGNLHYHLWFLYAIAGLYLIIPLIRPLVKNSSDQTLRYLLLVGCFFTFVQGYVRWNSGLNPAFTIPELTPWLLYFLAGHFFGKMPLKASYMRWILPMLIGGIILIIVPTWRLNQSAGASEQYFISNGSPGVCLMSVSLFLSIRILFERVYTQSFLTKFLTFLTPLSFGIYLVHEFFLQMFFHNGIRIREIGHAAITAPLITAMVIFISAIAVFTIRQIPLFRKYFT